MSTETCHIAVFDYFGGSGDGGVGIRTLFDCIGNNKISVISHNGDTTLMRLADLKIFQRQV